VRALRLRGTTPGDGPLRAILAHAASVLPASTADRPLDEDLALAQDLLAGLGGAILRAGQHGD
jgi:hypothetical protein